MSEKSSVGGRELSLAKLGDLLEQSAPIYGSGAARVVVEEIAAWLAQKADDVASEGLATVAVFGRLSAFEEAAADLRSLIEEHDMEQPR